MADQKLTDKTVQTELADNDIFSTVDVSDLSAGADGTSKKTAWTLIKSTLASLTESITGIKTFVNGLIVGTASGDWQIDAKNTDVSTSGTTYGARIITNAEPTGIASGFNTALAGRINYASSNQSSGGVAGVWGNAAVTLERPNVVMGGNFVAQYSGTEASVQAGSLYGVRANVSVSGGGYYNHIMGMKINPPNLSNGSTADSVWGIYIADVDVAGGTIYAALNIEGTGENNAISFSGDTKLWQDGIDLKTNEDFVFANTKYLWFEDSGGTRRGQIGISSGGEFIYQTNLGYQFKSTSVSDAQNFDIRNGNDDKLLRIKMGTGKIAINGTTVDEQVHVNTGNVKADGFKFSALNSAPATATSTGTLGDIRYTADYIYVCTATNTWKRTAIATW